MPLSLPAPRLLPADGVPSLRWGVVGTGIAARFVDALHAHTTQRVVAVTARDAEKTADFALEHRIPTVHVSVSALVNDPRVDVVYISTPHPLHRDLALEAIAAGKHVLVEKPIAMSAREAEEITSAGRAAGVLVTEAMWTRYLPQADVIRQVLDEGLLGEVNLVRADFGFVFPFEPTHRLWSAELGGGALLDAGVYPISFASSVLGAPAAVHAVGERSETGVDARADLLLTHASGAVAMLSTSLRTSLPTTASIMGSAGRLEIASPFFGPSALALTLEPSDAAGSGGSAETALWRDDSFATLHEGLSCQATAFAGYVADGRLESPLHPHAEIVSVMATIDEARRQVGTV